MGKSGDICRTTALALGAALALVLLIALTGPLGFLGAFIIAAALGGALVVGLLRFLCTAAEAPKAEVSKAGAVKAEAPKAETVVAPAPEPVVETPVAETPVKAAPVAAPVVTSEAGTPDDLKQLKGVGPKLAAALEEAGVTRFAQIAAWTEADVAWVEENVKGARGRIGRDGWIDQARELSAAEAG